MSDRTHHIMLPDGRRVAYAEYGDPGGTPILFHTGTYFSRLLPSEPALPAGVRLISIDRAGIGESDPSDRRSFAQSAADTNGLADSLHLNDYAILGWSSGTAHAMACAAHSPKRVRRLGLVAALPPWMRPHAFKDMDFQWAMIGRASNMSNRFNPMVRVVVGQVRKTVLNPKKILKLLARTPPDVAAVEKLRTGILASYAEAIKTGPQGAIDDIMTYVRPWDFDIATIRAATIVWHGDQDRICPHGADYITATIVGSRQTTFAGEGHLALFDHWDDVLREMTA
jgi:pimeloyl-ACP methyl ester carboxylesterase